jgi:hypothetical protein
MTDATVALYAAFAAPDDPIQSQLDALRQYAGDRGWRVVAEFVDRGAGWRQDRRPGLRRLMRAAQARTCTIVLAPDLAHFACSGTHVIGALYTFARLGIRFVAAATLHPARPHRSDAGPPGPTSRSRAAAARAQRETTVTIPAVCHHCGQRFGVMAAAPPPTCPHCQHPLRVFDPDRVIRRRGCPGCGAHVTVTFEPVATDRMITARCPACFEVWHFSRELRHAGVIYVPVVRIDLGD